MSTAALQTTPAENLSDSSSPQQIELTLTINETSSGLSMSWNPKSVTVNKATAKLTIKLSTTLSVLMTDDIKWMHPGVGHIGQPPAISRVRLAEDGQSLSFFDTNPEGNLTWTFAVWVWYDGTSYLSPDPTIINATVGP